MLRLLLGKARSGKTAEVFRMIREDGKRDGHGRSLLIVPEQYSHEAERELCAACGDGMSLYAEVVSFSGLARHVMAEQGGQALQSMDTRGRLVCMAAALREIRSLLSVFASAAENVELQALLVKELEVLQTAAVDSETLAAAALEDDEPLRRKITELLLIREAYEGVLRRSGCIPEHPLAILARQLENSGFNEKDNVYLDGFIDFTGQEKAVLRALMKQQVTLTVCFTIDENAKESELFLLSVQAMNWLCETAEELGISVVKETIGAEKEQGALGFYTDRMFFFADARYPEPTDAIRLVEAPDPFAACEAAAGEVLRTVREDGLRWRDIAIAIRGFEDYRLYLEECFRLYDIPLFTTRKDSMFDRPLPGMIHSAYELIRNGWETEDMLSYLQSGLCGLTDEETDLLSGYVFKWQLKESAWRSKTPWRQHPDGYGKVYTEDTNAELERIHTLRKRVGSPLLHLQERTEAADSAREQAEALIGFLQELDIPQRMRERLHLLDETARRERQSEYRQIWDSCVNAVEQITLVLGETSMDSGAFSSLLCMVLSQCTVGQIPVALDRVSAGDFDRMRRRNLRHLIVLGCSDDRIPMARTETGIFSADEKDRLANQGIWIGGGEAELWREYAMIYHTLTLPDLRCTLISPLTGFEGEKLEPSILYTRAGKMLAILPQQAELTETRMSASIPAKFLAAKTLRDTGMCSPEDRMAAAWYEKTEPDGWNALRQAARLRRGRLSPQAAERLYGKRLRLSPSRMERFHSCRFAYFCDYGMKAEHFKPIGFTPQEMGTFLHGILEKTAAEVKESGGFSQISDEELRKLTEKHIAQYIHEELNDFEEKSERFRHLFERSCEEACQIVLDMAEELRRSEFEPVSFELDISGLEPWEDGLEAGPQQESAIRLTGKADRVDGWVHDGMMYLRIVDYKTGRKQFELSDVWYGRNLQMLMYLFAVSKNSEKLYGYPGKSAGIMYMPARDDLLSFPKDPSKEEQEREKNKAKKRSGLLLNQGEVLSAWENVAEDEKKYTPSAGKTKKQPQISEEQMELLRGYLQGIVKETAEEMHNGSIDANPFYVGETENACQNCRFPEACQFRDGEQGETCCRMPKLSDEEVWGRIRGERENG